MKGDAARIDLHHRDWAGECLCALRDLAFSIDLFLHAVAKRNLEDIARQTANQERLCRVVYEAVVGLARTGNSEMKADIEGIIKQVWSQNRLQAAVLRRARRTTDIFCLVLAHSGVTYPDAFIPRATHG